MSMTPEKDHDGDPVDEGTLEAQLERVGLVDDETPYALGPDDEKRLWRKVDVRLIPMLSLMFLLSFMDRGNIGNAKLDGLMEELHLTGNRYNVSLTVFFFSYCTFECTANLAWKFFRPSRWLPGIMVAWGIVMTLMGFVKTYPQLVAVRFCLGVAEAGLFPGVVYYLTLWYPRHMPQYRVGLFFGAAAVAGAFSGLLAFGIGYMGGTAHLEGWSWIFIIEGLLTVVVGLISSFVIVDFPSTVTFLTPEERAYLVWKKKYDSSTTGEEERFAFRYVIAALTDWQVYVHLLVYISLDVPLYGITFFLPWVASLLTLLVFMMISSHDRTIINDFGYSTPISQLLTVPPYVIASIILLIWAHYSDKLKIRSAFIYVGLVLLLIGYSINISSASNGVKYFATFLVVTGSYGSFPGVIAWLGNNLSGHYKRGVGMAVQIGLGTFSGAIAANIYRLHDSPRYILGHGLELMFVSIGLIVVPILVFSYKHINDARDRATQQRIERGEKLQLTAQELKEMGDRAPDFRYTL